MTDISYGVTKKQRRFLNDSNPIAIGIAAIAIYSMIFPLILADLWTGLYQAVYFTIFDIPKISRKDYVVMDRWELAKLTVFQRVNCVYCEYANGVTAWMKAVAGQTEIFSCSIKHRHKVRGQLEGDEYYKYSDFRNS